MLVWSSCTVSLLTLENGWVQPCRRVPSPNYNERPAAEVSLLVIHNISLPPRNYGGPYIEQLFTNCLNADEHPFFAEIAHLQVSAHLLIRRDGELVQFVPFDKRAWHAGQSCYGQRVQCNDFSIGIELEGCDFEPFTSAQYEQLLEVTTLLLRHYPLLKPEHICGHEDIAPGRKTDPGPYFDWQRYRQALAERLDKGQEA